MLAKSNNKVNTITPGQKTVLEFIFRYIELHGYSPTLQEIADEIEYSLGTAQHYVEELEKKGFVRKSKNKSRAVLPVDGSSVTVMKLGLIAAGKPIEHVENPEPVLVPKSMVSRTGQYYALEVRGDSMADDGIWDKDIIVVKHQFTAEENDTVVAVTEDGATLKQLKYKDGKPYLQPKNRNYSPIFPKGKLEIRGKFVGLIRHHP
ncbi:MAG: LexA repressor [Candidatus Collierbacteria bacterium GW2011_GWE2_42_48]|nr:MAG: LexA repressor [Candidatus Collierbacteria bacterium GW2011_GWE2_42_48]